MRQAARSFFNSKFQFEHQLLLGSPSELRQRCQDRFLTSPPLMLDGISRTRSQRKSWPQKGGQLSKGRSIMKTFLSSSVKDIQNKKPGTLPRTSSGFMKKPAPFQNLAVIQLLPYRNTVPSVQVPQQTTNHLVRGRVQISMKSEANRSLRLFFQVLHLVAVCARYRWNR